ncbi:MAG: hypothetical protein KA319_14425 [Ferruginibacter sp.]|nr:hypothetical protein [Ferruginibacter sp.]
MAKAKIIEADITDLKFDDKNFNVGSEFGNSLMDKSFSQFKAGRGALVDKNNNIIAGNKSIEKFGELGGKKVIIVETTGDEIVVTKRTDIDLNTPQGREMALADNATAKANIVWAEDVIAEEIGVEVAESWGVDYRGAQNDGGKDPFDDDGVEAKNKFGVIVMCENESEQEHIFTRLTGEGFNCKIVVV